MHDGEKTHGEVEVNERMMLSAMDPKIIVRFN